MAEYFVRADGTADFAQALGPSTNAALCMSLSTYTSGRAALRAGDTVTFTSRGGDFTGQVTIDQSGSSGNYITYQGESGNTPTIDLSAQDTLASCLFIEASELEYVRVDGFTCVGNGSRAAVWRNETTSGSKTVELGKNAQITVTSNNADVYTGSRSYDGFSWNGNCLDRCGTLSASNCSEPTPATGAHQGFTTHDTCAVEVDKIIGGDNNHHIVEANGSSFIAYDADMEDAFVSAYRVSSAGGTVKVLGGTTDLDTTAVLFQILTTDGTGNLVLNIDATIAGTDSSGANTTVQETGWGGVVDLMESNITINTYRARWQPNANSSIRWAGKCTLTLADNSNFILTSPQSGSGAANFDFEGLYITSPAGSTGSPRFMNIDTTEGGTINLANTVWDTPIFSTEALIFGSSAVCDLILDGATVFKLATVAFLDCNLNGTTPESSFISCRNATFHDCFDALDVTDYAYIDLTGTTYTGSTPDETSNHADAVYRRQGGEIKRVA